MSDVPKSLDTPQTRRRLERRVANVFPGCRVEWQPAERGALAFRLLDGHGRHRSGVVRVLPWHEAGFTKSWLESAVRRASGPVGGVPPVSE